MNENSPMLLIGIGGSGSAMARGVNRAFGDGLRYLLTDTDATTAHEGEPFTLLGGDRLAGHGAGGDFVSAKLAAADSISAIDDALEGVRLAVIVTALGGGTGGGATLETVRHLTTRGIPSIVFATTPFAFEGANRQQIARTVQPLIEEESNASFFLPMDTLVGNETDNMEEALRRGVDTLASAVTLFWRLVEKPGYIRLDTERIRHLIAHAGRGRFAVVTAQGPNRAPEAIDALTRSPLLAEGSAPVNGILCGVLAGEDLRLSEIGKIADGLRKNFGEQCSFELATVNDEATFAGRLAVVALLFEADSKDAGEQQPTGVTGTARRLRKSRNPLALGPQGRGRFNNAEPTVWNGEDLDIPTFIRHNINLDF